MKKQILSVTTIALLTLSISYTGCKKDDADTTSPVVSLNGSATTYWQVNKTYTDANATAHDDTDGSVGVTSTGTVNTSAIGTYIITYTAKDAAGNKGTATRTVYVVNFDGTYTLVQSAFTDASANGTGTSTVIASTNSNINGMTISNFDFYSANVLNATFSGQSITVAPQTSAAGPTFIVKASGTITGAGTVSSPLKFTFQQTEMDTTFVTNQGTSVFTKN